MWINIENFREFSQKHGNDQIEIGGMLIWSDGATSDLDTGNIRRDPPSDPIALLKIKRKYWTARVERAITVFVKTKSHIASQAALSAKYRNLPAPGEADVKHLELLKSQVESYRKNLDEIELELRGPENPSSIIDQLESECQSRVANTIHNVSTINI